MTSSSPSTRRSRLVAFMVATALTIVAVWLTVRGQDLGQVVAAFDQMTAWPYIICLSCLVMGTLARGVRFHMLMRRAGSRLTYALEMILIGYFFITLLPLRTGEFVRIGYFARRSGAPVLTVTSAIVVERGLDLLALAFLGAVFLSGAMGRQFDGLPIPPWLLGSFAGAGVVGAVLLGLVARHRVAHRAGAGRLARYLNDLLEGLRALGSPVDAAVALVMTLGLWLLVALSTKIAFLSLGQSVPYADAMVIMLGTCFTIALPSSPGFIGTYHLGFVAGALLVGIPRELSIPVAVVLHLVIQVPFLPVGGLVLLTGGRRALAQPPPPDPDSGEETKAEISP